MDYETDTPSETKEIHPSRDMEHPDHPQDWQCCHCVQRNGTLQSRSPGLGRNKVDTVRQGQVGQWAVHYLIWT